MPYKPDLLFATSLILFVLGSFSVIHNLLSSRLHSPVNSAPVFKKKVDSRQDSSSVLFVTRMPSFPLQVALVELLNTGYNIPRKFWGLFASSV